MLLHSARSSCSAHFINGLTQGSLKAQERLLLAPWALLNGQTSPAHKSLGYICSGWWGSDIPLPFHGVASVTVWLQGFKAACCGLQLLRTLFHVSTSNMRPIPASAFSLISATHEFFGLRSPQKIAAQSRENKATPPTPPAPAPSSLPQGVKSWRKKLESLTRRP